MTGHTPIAEISGLMAYSTAPPAKELQQKRWPRFYAYESQVQRVAQEKGTPASAKCTAPTKKTCGYFTLHATADVHPPTYGVSNWKSSCSKSRQPKGLAAGEAAAKSLGTRWMDRSPRAAKSQPRSRTSPRRLMQNQALLFFVTKREDIIRIQV